MASKTVGVTYTTRTLRFFASWGGTIFGLVGLGAALAVLTR